MLPHNLYHVSLDSSRRVTQLTRAHLKQISIFPIRVSNGFFVRPLPRTLSEALPVADHDQEGLPGAFAVINAMLILCNTAVTSHLHIGVIIH